MVHVARTTSHWNKNVLCAVSIKTTGPRYRFHEVYQFSVVPLRSDYSIDNQILPFNVLIKPDSPELIDWKYVADKEKLRSAIDFGINAEDVPDVFEVWFENKLDPSYNTKGYNRCKILPLAHSWECQRLFIVDLLTRCSYDDWFDSHVRDIGSVANFVNDVYAQHGEKVPYSKTTVKYLANLAQIQLLNNRDALQECAILQQLYKWMINNMNRSIII